MQPFSNIRVLDLTHVIAGPFCTYQLGVMGAEVIKIEPPKTPDMVRAQSHIFPKKEQGLNSNFAAQGANKKAISIDLRSESGQGIMKALIASADVLVENFRSGALAALGLGYDDVKSIKPDLIYCSMTGFGQDGPKGQHTAYDNVIQAFSGMMASTGSDASGPVKIGPPVLDYGTGIQAAYAIAAALFARSQTGEGQYIDVAMLDAAIMLMSANVTYYNEQGKLMSKTGNMSASNAGYGCYDTKDGQLMIGAYTGTQVKDLWHVLGEPEHGNTFAHMQVPEMAPYLKDETEHLQRRLMEKTADEWEVLMNENKVPAARVRHLNETLAHEQLESRTLLQHPGTEDIPTSPFPTAAFKFRSNGPSVKSAPPMFGQHTKEVLNELGYSDSHIDELAHQGVVDLG